MRTILPKIILFTGGLACSMLSFAQDTIRMLPPGYDPHTNKIIPDKFFEFGIPLLIIYLLANTVVNIFKITAERRLKEKALDRQLSEATLVTLFSEDKQMLKYVYIKWMLVLGALGISALVLHLLAEFAGIKSGYLSLGIIMLLLAMALGIYYNIIKNK